MLSNRYFHTDSLRQRFARHVHEARSAGRIDASEQQWLLHLEKTGQPAAQTSLYSLPLEDGSPVPIGLATALLIVHRQSEDEVLYLDTLSHGLERFITRLQLAARLKHWFGVRADLDPRFEYRVVQGDLFKQRMLQTVQFQAKALCALADELDKLPALDEVVAAVLEPRVERLWPGERVDVQAPVVQIVYTDKDTAGVSTEHVLRVDTPRRLALDALVGDVLPAGQSQRVLGHRGQPLKAVSDALFVMRPADLRGDYEQRLADYWTAVDEQGLSRRDRTAQAIANGFADQFWQWQLQHPEHRANKGLLELGILPLTHEPTVPVKRLTVSTEASPSLKLVSLYWIEATPGGPVLYSPHKGLRALVDRAALETLFNSPAGRLELRHYLSADDQLLLGEGDELKLQDYPLAGPLFVDCIDAIIAAQKRNLSEALERTCDDISQMRAMLDDALDVRTLIDPRLPACQSGARWAAQPDTFTLRWPQGGTPQPQARDEQALSWMEQVSFLDTMLATLNTVRPGLQALTQRALAPWLAVLEPSRQTQTVLLRWTGPVAANTEDNRLTALPATSVAKADSTRQVQRLSDLLLERYSGFQAASLAPDSQLLFDDGQGSFLQDAIPSVEVELLEHLLQQAATRLATLCAGDLASYYSTPQRTDDGQYMAGPILYAMQDSLLRLELEAMCHLDRFGSAQRNMVRQVLERPVRAMRLVCGEQLTEVQALRLNVEGRDLAVPLRSAWVMQQPALAVHGLLLWSPLTGIETLQSPTGLLHWLKQCFELPEQRARWLDLLSAEDAQWLDQCFAQPRTPAMRLTLESVQGNFLQNMQAQDQRLHQGRLDRVLIQARQAKMAGATLSRHYNRAGSLEGHLAWQDAVAIRIQNMLFETVLPDWLSKASDADLELYSGLLNAYYSHGDPDEDFLADIPALRDFAREQVLEALQRDFPGHPLEPLQITLTMTRYVAAPVPPGSIPSSLPAATLVISESLVDFALNHFSRIQDGSLSVSLPAGKAVPAGLSPQYLMSLVHALDVGQRYQTLLATHFAPGRADYPQRRQRFMTQIPARMLLPALEMKLQGQLSQTAFDYLRCVMEMPDGKARQPVHGQDIVVRPLTLQPRKDMHADSVEGLFLIGPRDASQGPVILHTLFNDWFSLKEYRTQDDLLNHMQSQSLLQTLVLDRVSPVLRKRYANGGLIEAHIPWSTEGFLDIPMSQPGRVTLGTEEIQGNALLHLFGATLQLLEHLSGKQSVTSAQADWASFVHVVTLGAEQVLSFLPGKIGFLVAAWQTRGLLRESASAVSQQRWGKALSEFSAALGMLVMARREHGELTRSRVRTQLPGFSWRHSALPQEVAARLRQFEVQDIELARLDYNQLYNLYQQPGTLNRYAAVAGKVYAIHQRDGIWRIQGACGDGPPVRLNQNQQWELNLQPGLRGGGLLPLHTEQAMQLKAEQYMTIQAHGMTRIRAWSREQARQIGGARQQALRYLDTALLNLNAPFAQGLASPVRNVLKDFFGVQDPGLVLIDSLRHHLNELYDGLSEPSLSALDSDRFVIGVVKPGYENMAAFVISKDPQKRIYLGDMFFAPPPHMLKQDNHHPAFNADDHFRAMALLHEMSHVVSRTRDIAYLDASAPPQDLLDESSAGTLSYKQDLQRLRERALSHRTPAAELFRTRENNTWRDLRVSDGQVFHTILRLSGQSTLGAARQAFLGDLHVRRRIILSNADSVAMLVALLGRERFTSAAR